MSMIEQLVVIGFIFIATFAVCFYIQKEIVKADREETHIETEGKEDE